MGKTYYVMDLDMYNPLEWASEKREVVAASETDAAGADVIFGGVLVWAEACGLLLGREPHTDYLARLKAERHAAATVEEYSDGMRFRVLVATKPDGSDARLHEGRCSITVVFKTSKSSDYELPAPVADEETT